MVHTADPALFHVVDGQGEADLERPVPCLLHQFGLYHLHGESREAEGGQCTTARSVYLDGVSRPRGSRPHPGPGRGGGIPPVSSNGKGLGFCS